MSRRAIDRGLVALSVLALFAALYHGAGWAAIQARAWLAPVLIERAWRQTLAGVDGVRPWPWADTWPVARLVAPGRGVDLLVLAGDAGHALAFGPGHNPASAAPGTRGMAVIGGHRDTHFAFLRELEPGAPLELELPSGERRRYRVAAARVIDVRREPAPAAGGAEALLLVTCYPFDALRPGGPLRYIVDARPERPPGALL